jgi:hypothetical protein
VLPNNEPHSRPALYKPHIHLISAAFDLTLLWGALLVSHKLYINIFTPTHENGHRSEHLRPLLYGERLETDAVGASSLLYNNYDNLLWSGSVSGSYIQEISTQPISNPGLLLTSSHFDQSMLNFDLAGQHSSTRGETQWPSSVSEMFEPPDSTLLYIPNQQGDQTLTQSTNSPFLEGESVNMPQSSTTNEPESGARNYQPPTTNQTRSKFLCSGCEKSFSRRCDLELVLY